MATAQSIAKLCGVSRTTVWAVLTGRAGVGPDTREKVLAAIRQNGYQPPAMRRSLKAHFSHVVAVVLRDLHNPFFTEVLAGVREVLGRHGLHTLYHGSDVRLEEDEAAFRLFSTVGVGGYVVSSMDTGPAHSVLKRLVEEGTPVVSVGGGIPDLPTHTVSSTFREGSREAAEHLVCMGHRRIAYLAGPPRWTDERVLGFVEALLRHKVQFEDRMLVNAGDSEADGYRVGMDLLRDPARRPTALACFNDLLATGVYRAVQELGLRVPDDISVVGFDNIGAAGILGPPLTTVDAHPRALGRTAAEVLLQAIRGELRGQETHRTVASGLVERASVRRLGQAPAQGPPRP